MRSLRDTYAPQTGRRLESEVARLPGPTSNVVMAHLLHGMSLREKIEHYETSKSMENLIAHATPAELEELTRDEAGKLDPSILSRLRETMTDDAFLEARLTLFPEAGMEAVRDRIDQADRHLDNDEGGAMAAFHRLELDARRQLLDSHPSLLSFMSGTQRLTLRHMTKSETAGLEARLLQATRGLGTDDDALPGIIHDVAELGRRSAALQSALSAGPLPDGRHLQLRRELDELGDVRQIVEPRRNHDGSLAAQSFLGRLGLDVKREELHGYMRELGVSDFEVGKQVVLDAMTRWNDDERAVQEAFAALPKGERQALWNDPHIQMALSGMTDTERTHAAAFRDGDALAMASQRVEDADGWFAQDEAGMVEAVLELDADQREAFQQSALYRATHRRMHASEALAYEEALNTGTLSLQTGILAASGGFLERTDEAMISLALGERSDSDALELRSGFVLSREGRLPSTPEEAAAVDRFESLESHLADALDGDALHALLAHTSTSALAERSAPEGRMRASQLENYRADEKMGPDGRGGGRLADAFLDEDETAIQSHQAQKAMHIAATADGQVDPAELSRHAALAETFGEDYQAMLDAQNEVVDTAAMVGTSALMLLGTLASGGTFGGAAAAFMLRFGTATTTTAMTLGSMGTKELMGGERYDMLGREGGADLALSAIDALQAQATWHLGNRAVDYLGGQALGIAAPVTRAPAPHKSPGSWLAEQAPGLVAGSVADSGVGVFTDALQENLLSEDFWHHDLGGMLQSLGDSAGAGIERLPADIARGLALRTGMMAGQAGTGVALTKRYAALGFPTSTWTPETLRDLQIHESRHGPFQPRRSRSDHASPSPPTFAGLTPADSTLQVSRPAISEEAHYQRFVLLPCGKYGGGLERAGSVRAHDDRSGGWTRRGGGPCSQ